MSQRKSKLRRKKNLNVLEPSKGSHMSRRFFFFSSFLFFSCIHKYTYVCFFLEKPHPIHTHTHTSTKNRSQISLALVSPAQEHSPNENNQKHPVSKGKERMWEKMQKKKKNCRQLNAWVCVLPVTAREKISADNTQAQEKKKTTKKIANDFLNFHSGT